MKGIIKRLKALVMKRLKVRKRLLMKMSWITMLIMVMDRKKERRAVKKLSLFHVLLSQGTTRLVLKIYSFHMMLLPMLMETQRSASWPSMQ